VARILENGQKMNLKVIERKKIDACDCAKRIGVNNHSTLINQKRHKIWKWINKLGWNMNDGNPPAHPSCLGKNEFGTVCGTLAELLLKNTHLGLSVWLWLDARGARKLRGQIPSACRAPLWPRLDNIVGYIWWIRMRAILNAKSSSTKVQPGMRATWTIKCKTYRKIRAVRRGNLAKK